MLRNRHISSIPRVTMPIGERGVAGGLRMLAGTGHSFCSHIALNCNVGTRLRLQESKCYEIGIYQSSPGVPGS